MVFRNLPSESVTRSLKLNEGELEFSKGEEEHVASEVAFGVRTEACALAGSAPERESEVLQPCGQVGLVDSEQTLAVFRVAAAEEARINCWREIMEVKEVVALEVAVTKGKLKLVDYIATTYSICVQVVTLH